MNAYAPTHTVPATGLDTWSTPDAAAAPSARLDPWLDVQLLRTWGSWAEVQCSNGWSAWVDGRALVATATAPVAAPSGSGAVLAAGVALVLLGAVVAVIGAYLPWLRLGEFGSVSSAEIPVTALLDPRTTVDGPFSIAVLLDLLATGAAVLAFLRPLVVLRRLLGVAILGVVGLFGVQMVRVAGDAFGQLSPLDYLGLGLPVAVVGGLLVVLAPRG